MNIRYIRNTISGSSANTGNHWVQIAAWVLNRSNQSITDSASNAAFGKTVTGSTTQNTSYPYSRITNGDLTTSNYATPASAATGQYVTVDLGSLKNIEFVQVWHYYGDLRIYFQNTTSVSADGSTWITIQNPTGSNVETSTGVSYSLYDADYNNQVIKSNVRTSLYDSLNKLIVKRGGTTVIPTSGEYLVPTDYSSFYTKLNEFNVSWANIVAKGNNITDDNTEEVMHNIMYASNNASCAAGCSYSCAVGCSTICYGSCGKGCGGTCQSGCGANCTTSCGTSCSGNCGGTCSATCAGSCTGSCTTGCTGTCAKNCSGTAGG